MPVKQRRSRQKPILVKKIAILKNISKLTLKFDMIPLFVK